ncbi:MAG: hypothetical protein R3B83_10755 [Nitrospirales bacterium]|nr:hypothetical protein [Nitrospirales bacterium]
MSALTKNQVIAFVISVVICLGFILSGFPLVLDFLWVDPQIVLSAISSFSFLTHFQSINKGVLDLRDIVFFFH